MSKPKSYKFVKAPKDYPGPVYSWGRRVLEHHLIWWLHTGDVVPKGYHVHHKNKDIRDNRFENLELLSASEHTHKHKPKRPNVHLVCAWCGVKIVRSRLDFESKKQQGQNRFFCNSSHAALFGHTVLSNTQRKHPKHGMYIRYVKGCRCSRCREANAERMRHYRQSKKDKTKKL